MENGLSEKPSKPIVNILIRIGICSLVLFIGVVGMKTLAAMKKPPAEIKSEERPLRVEILEAVAGDLPVTITAYGEVAALNTVTLAPEVSGRITGTHPRLETGEVIEKGAVLFRVDDRDYRASVMEAQASAAQLGHTIQRLEKQFAIDRHRLKTILRNRDLALAEFERIRKLHDTGKVVSQSTVDNAEQQYNNRADLADQMAQTVALYPLRIKETESGLAAARARLLLAETRLQRCQMTAPFDGRIKNVSLEKGQYVNPGQAVLTLADDSMLEIRVSLDSRDARQWLLFNKSDTRTGTAWFGNLKPAACRIRWTEGSGNHVWQGHLHRVVAFDKENRTLTVAVRIDGDNALPAGGNDLPLVEGMFCSVEIPGRTLKNVIRLPRSTVSFENTVYLAENRRLKTVSVKVARIQGEEAVVEGGLSPGDRVIITRLVDPLENALLEITGRH